MSHYHAKPGALIVASLVAILDSGRIIVLHVLSDRTWQPNCNSGLRIRREYMHRDFLGGIPIGVAPGNNSVGSERSQ